MGKNLKTALINFKYHAKFDPGSTKLSPAATGEFLFGRENS